MTYVIQQIYHPSGRDEDGAPLGSPTWIDVPEGDFDSEQEAAEALRDLERNLGWRDLRIVERQ